MSARDLILAANLAAGKRGLSQSEWSARAGMATGGQGVSKLLSRGDCRLSTILALLQPLGMTLEIVQIRGDDDDGQNAPDGR